MLKLTRRALAMAASARRARAMAAKRKVHRGTVQAHASFMRLMVALHLQVRFLDATGDKCAALELGQLMGRLEVQFYGPYVCLSGNLL